MNRKLFKWISELVASGPDRSTTRPVSALGSEVIERYRCGHLHNGKLVFTAQDKLELRQRVAEETGFDPLRERLPDGELCINGGRITLQPASIMTAGVFCPSSGIEIVDHDALVVVENLPVMSLCHAFEMPQSVRRALWVYRGDPKTGSKINVCHDFIDRFGANKTVVVFSDMDPKGLEIALTMPHAHYWLGPVPESWQTWLQK